MLSKNMEVRNLGGAKKILTMELRHDHKHESFDYLKGPIFSKSSKIQDG